MRKNTMHWNKKLLVVISILVISVIAVTSYLYILSTKDKQTEKFEKTISNNFVSPHVSAQIIGSIKSGDEIRIDQRDGVDSLTINGSNYTLTIVIFGPADDSAIQYQSIAKVANSKIVNLFRTMDPKDWYLDGFGGWHYSNVLSNDTCTKPSTGVSVSPACGSGRIEKENISLDVACNIKGVSNLVKECDAIMQTLEIIVVK